MDHVCDVVGSQVVVGKQLTRIERGAVRELPGAGEPDGEVRVRARLAGDNNGPNDRWDDDLCGPGSAEELPQEALETPDVRLTKHTDDLCRGQAVDSGRDL